MLCVEESRHSSLTIKHDPRWEAMRWQHLVRKEHCWVSGTAALKKDINVLTYERIPPETLFRSEWTCDALQVTWDGGLFVNMTWAYIRLNVWKWLASAKNTIWLPATGKQTSRVHSIAWEWQKLSFKFSLTWALIVFLGRPILQHGRGGAYGLYRSHPPGGNQDLLALLLVSSHSVYLYIRLLFKP